MTVDSAADTMMIPEDLIFMILLWLPVGSLLRFKSVCKSWLSIIDSSSFISRQLLSSSTCDDNDNDRHIILLDPMPYRYKSPPRFSFAFTFVSDHLSRYIDFPPRPFDKPFDFPKLVAGFNGLVFINDGDFGTDHFLWNPATKQVRVLPSPLIDTKDGVYDAEERTVVDYGFGFNVENNDYRIVRVVSEDVTSSHTPMKYQVEVYSLNSNSWIDRTHDVVLPPNFVVSSHPGSPFRNNQIYCWLGYTNVLDDPQPVDCEPTDPPDYPLSIRLFDFSNETFRAIQLPDVYIFHCPTSLRLALVRDQLGCIEWVTDSAIDRCTHLICCKIWVLEEYGVKESWTNLYTVVLNSPVFAVRSYINGKIIWDPPTGHQTKLCSCDPVTHEVHNLPFQIGGTPVLVDYKESLVSIVGRNGEQIG